MLTSVGELGVLLYIVLKRHTMCNSMARGGGRLRIAHLHDRRGGLQSSVREWVIFM